MMSSLGVSNDFVSESDMLNLFVGNATPEYSLSKMRIPSIGNSHIYHKLPMMLQCHPFVSFTFLPFVYLSLLFSRIFLRILFQQPNSLSTTLSSGISYIDNEEVLIRKIASSSLYASCMLKLSEDIQLQSSVRADLLLVVPRMTTSTSEPPQPFELKLKLTRKYYHIQEKEPNTADNLLVENIIATSGPFAPPHGGCGD